MQAPQLVSSIVGESERRLAAVFAGARSAAPCILFIDQLEALGACISRSPVPKNVPQNLPQTPPSASVSGLLLAQPTRCWSVACTTRAHACTRHRSTASGLRQLI